MEQAIKCTNDSNKNAIRLCDDCDLPFCAECLRKNLLGLYYCQWCYPALFKDTLAPEYEIPIDEKGLIKIQSKIQAEVKNNDINNYNNPIEGQMEQSERELMKKGIKVIIISGLLIPFMVALIFSLPIYLQGLVGGFISTVGSIAVSLLIIISIYIVIIPYYGYKYGKQYPQLLWIIGMCLTLPLFLFTYITSLSNHSSDAVALSQNLYIFDCISLILSYIGAYIGARKKKLKLYDNL